MQLLFIYLVVFKIISASSYKNESMNNEDSIESIGSVRSRRSDSDSNDLESVEEAMFRKGGLNNKQKSKLYLSHVYVSPKVRDKIKLNRRRDLYDYTICKGFASEVWNNFTTMTFRYYVCPDEGMNKTTVDTVKEYCCYNGTKLNCCNKEEFINYYNVRQEKIIAILWKVAYVIAIGIVIVTVLCTLKKYLRRSRFGNILFRQQPQHVPIMTQPMVGGAVYPPQMTMNAPGVVPMAPGVGYSQPGVVTMAPVVAYPTPMAYGPGNIEYAASMQNTVPPPNIPPPPPGTYPTASCPQPPEYSKVQ